MTPPPLEPSLSFHPNLLRDAFRKPRIQPAMSAFRAFFAILVGLVLALTATASSAQETSALPSEAQTLTLPADVPHQSAGDAVIPAVPTSHIVRDLGWLKFSYPPAAAERVASILQDANSIKTELSETLGQDVLRQVEVRITESTAEMKALSPLHSPPPTYASGVAYHGLHLVLISMFAPTGPDATNLDQVFRHELAHVALEDATAGHHVPVWFNEGLAVGLAGENTFDRQTVLSKATIFGTLLPLAELDRSFPRDHGQVNIAYAQSVDFMRFLMRRTDQVRFAGMIQRVREGQPFERALASAYDSDIRKLEFQWRGEVERRYSVYPILAGGGLIWVLVIGALVWAYAKKRRRAQAILQRWAKEEAIEDALVARRAAEAKDESDQDLARLSLQGMTPRSPAKVEHEGDWHTLH